MTNELLTSAADRNQAPILTVLKSVLPNAGEVLEVASGSGQHVCFFAAALPQIRWQPTEPDAAHRAAIMTRVRAADLGNVEPPIELDVHAPRWAVAPRYDAILCSNMIHISPWSATNALCLGAARHLRPRGLLVLYGPFIEDGKAAPSNLDFDASLKRRNAAWGVRELADVTRIAGEHGLTRAQIVRMPANNLTVVYAKSP